MYPIDSLTWGQVLLVVLGLLGLTLWVWLKIGQPATVGLMAVVISFITAWGWFGSVPIEAAALVVCATFLLFGIGMFMPEMKDDWFHLGAMAVALLGKLFVWILAGLGPILTGEDTVPRWLWLTLVLLTVIGFAGWRFERVRGWGHRFTGRLKRKPAAPVAPAAPATT